MYEVIEQHWGLFSSRQISLLKSDKCELQKLVARADEEEEVGAPAKKARTDDGPPTGLRSALCKISARPFKRIFIIHLQNLASIQPRTDRLKFGGMGYGPSPPPRGQPAQ